MRLQTNIGHRRTVRRSVGDRKVGALQAACWIRCRVSSEHLAFALCCRAIFIEGGLLVWQTLLLPALLRMTGSNSSSTTNMPSNTEEDGEIISRKTIENSIDNGVAYRIREDGKIVGGLVLTINEETQHNHLDLLFVTPGEHSKGVGTAAWKEAERLYPGTKVWETCTPYFETRNIHFYVNKCGFQIVEFFNRHHPDPHDPETGEENNYDGEDFDGMFRFEKLMMTDK